LLLKIFFTLSTDMAVKKNELVARSLADKTDGNLRQVETCLTSRRGCKREMTTTTCGIFMNLERVVVISFNSHDMTFTPWHIFTTHKALWLLKNSLNTKVHTVAVSVMPECVVVLFSAH
jgi:hypothetical protein